MINELSIIIPTLNEAEYLPFLLDSIGEQTFAGKLQVIVVDGSSTDDTVTRARSFSSRIPDLLVLQSKKDIGHQKNVGAQKAKYRFLLFLDADVILPPTLLADIASKIHTNGKFIIGVMHRFEGMSIVDNLYFGVGCIFLACFLAFRMPVTNGDFMLTTRENYDNVEGFKEGVVLGEDVDFGKRSIQAGAKYYFCFRPQVIASLRRAHKMGRMRLLVMWVPAFMRVSRHGPIYRGQGLDDYPFGHYGSLDADSSSSSKSSRTP